MSYNKKKKKYNKNRFFFIKIIFLPILLAEQIIKYMPNIFKTLKTPKKISACNLQVHENGTKNAHLNENVLGSGQTT